MRLISNENCSIARNESSLVCAKKIDICQPNIKQIHISFKIAHYAERQTDKQKVITKESRSF